MRWGSRRGGGEEREGRRKRRRRRGGEGEGRKRERLESRLPTSSLSTQPTSTQVSSSVLLLTEPRSKHLSGTKKKKKNISSIL